MASLRKLWNREFWRSVSEVPMRHGRQDGRTFIIALGCEVRSCLTRGLIETVVCLPIYDLVIGGWLQKMMVEPNSKQPSRRAGRQEPESEPDFEP